MTKKKKKDDLSKISSNEVKIIIWQRFGSNVKHKRSEYFATEEKDSYGNPVVINKKRNHDEDFGFSQDEIYSTLATTYNIEGKPRNDVLNLIDESMNKLKKRIEALNEFPELSVFANIWDEKEKLERLRIFRKYVALRSDNGSYYKEEDGLRVYDFDSVDGFLIPIWHDADNLIDLSDYTYNKKVTMQETAELKELLDSKKRQNIKYASFFMMMIVTLILAGILTFGVLKTLDYHNDAVAEWEAPAKYCADQSAKIMGTMTNILDNEVVKGCLLKNNKSDIINKVNNQIKTLETKK